MRHRGVTVVQRNIENLEQTFTAPLRPQIAWLTYVQMQATEYCQIPILKKDGSSAACEASIPRELKELGSLSMLRWAI